MGDVFDNGDNRVVSCEWRVYDDSKVFHLQIGLVQGFKEASVIEVVVKQDGKVGIHDGSDQCGVFGRGWE